jgi:hypothetical protein
MRFYARYYISIDGKLDGEAESVDVKYNGDPMPITTLVQDLAGFYLPPKNATVTVKGFIPASGDRVDYVSYFLDNNIVSVKVSTDSGETMIAQGMINGPSLSSSPADPSRIDVSMTVTASNFT